MIWTLSREGLYGGQEDVGRCCQDLQIAHSQLHKFDSNSKAQSYVNTIKQRMDSNRGVGYWGGGLYLRVYSMGLAIIIKEGEE